MLTEEVNIRVIQTNEFRGVNYKTKAMLFHEISSEFCKQDRGAHQRWISAADLWKQRPSRSTSTTSSRSSSTRSSTPFTLSPPTTGPQPHQNGPDPCGEELVPSARSGRVTVPTPHSKDSTMAEITNCPVCHEPAIDLVQRINTKTGVVTADAICSNQHLWVTRWLLPAVPIRDQEAS